MTVVSGNIRFMRIFAEVLWRRGVKRKNVDFHFGRYVFGTFESEANIIILFSLCRFSTDPKIHDRWTDGRLMIAIARFALRSRGKNTTS